MELPPNQFGVPPMPVIIQEAPQASTQAPLNFDVMAAQSRGKPIAPRQPPAPPSMPIEIMDDRHQHPQPPPQPDIRANQRGKRGRETEDFETSESRSSSNFSKRRKHPMEPAGAPMVMSNVGEGHVAPFNPAVGYPMAPAPPRIPQDSDLDELCIRFRETYRILKAGFEENERMQSEIYEAALGRANARVVQAQQSADDLSVSFSEDMKELVRLRDQRMATQLEFEHRDQQYDALQEENQRLRDEHARTLGECTQLRGEIARKDERIAALSEALEHERREPLSRPDMNTPTVPQPSPMDVVQQEIHAAKQNAERADAANDLLAEEIRRLRSDHAADRRKFEEVEAENRRKFYEVKAEHENLSAALEDFVSKDLEELTQKMIKKHVLGLKEADQQVANKIKEANRSFNKPDQLASGDANKPSGPTSNGRIPQEQS